MKSKIIILALVVILIGLFSMFNITNSYPFKENVLYNQDDISGYNETQTESSNLVNRNEAIKIAKYYIGNILGNDLSEEDNKMYVNLYRNDSNADSYYWNISWSRPNLSCGVEINTINKEINELNTPSVKPISIISLMSPSPSDSFLNIFVVIIFSKYININIKAPDSIWLKNELIPKNFK